MSFRQLLICCGVFFALNVAPLGTPLLMAQPNRPLVPIGVANQAAKPVSSDEYREVLCETRGLIQNELEVVKRLCNPSKSQVLDLVNKAETEWFVKTGDSSIQRLQRSWMLSGEIDGLVERVMQQWVAEVLSPEQSVQYNEELDDRWLSRKEAVLTQIVVTLQQRLQLTAPQVERVEKILDERWKDRWYRTIEGVFDGEGLHPEINRTWLDGVLTSSQRKGLTNRSMPSRTNGRPPEYPRRGMEQRFQIGDVVSQVDLVSLDSVLPVPLSDKK